MNAPHPLPLGGEATLKYRWSRPTGCPDIVLYGNDGDRRVGKVEKSITGTYWLWFVTFDHHMEDPYTCLKLNGAAAGAREAVAACEACYEAALSGMGTGVRTSRIQEAIERPAKWRRERTEELTCAPLNLVVSNT